MELPAELKARVVAMSDPEERGIRSLSRIVPIEKSFQFSPERAVEEFAQAAKPLIERIRKGESFCVKVERRRLLIECTWNTSRTIGEG